MSDEKFGDLRAVRRDGQLQWGRAAYIADGVLLNWCVRKSDQKLNDIDTAFLDGDVQRLMVKETVSVRIMG